MRGLPRTVNSETLHYESIDKLPERKLWISVLNLAVEDYKHRKCLTKAGWSSYIFSNDFRTICDLSGHHPEYARRKFIKSRESV